MSLHIRELGSTPFSKVSVFVCPHGNEGFLTASVFKSLHFQRLFQKSRFSVETSLPTYRLRVDGRLKRIKMYAFSYENIYVWTGLEKPCPWVFIEIQVFGLRPW